MKDREPDFVFFPDSEEEISRRVDCELMKKLAELFFINAPSHEKPSSHEAENFKEI